MKASCPLPTPHPASHTMNLSLTVQVVATAHVVFSSPRVYLSTKTALRQFFLDEGVTQVRDTRQGLLTQFFFFSLSLCKF